VWRTRCNLGTSGWPLMTLIPSSSRHLLHAAYCHESDDRVYRPSGPSVALGGYKICHHLKAASPCHFRRLSLEESPNSIQIGNPSRFCPPLPLPTL
jgi:hypothetical protein